MENKAKSRTSKGVKLDEFLDKTNLLPVLSGEEKLKLCKYQFRFLFELDKDFSTRYSFQIRVEMALIHNSLLYSKCVVSSIFEMDLDRPIETPLDFPTSDFYILACETFAYNRLFAQQFSSVSGAITADLSSPLFEELRLNIEEIVSQTLYGE